MPQIQLRRGSADDWTTYNPTLSAGEAGVELDTGRLKIGNGTSPWNLLPYTPRVIDAAQLSADAVSTRLADDGIILGVEPALEVQAPGDAELRVKSTGGGADPDALLVLDAAPGGESQVVFTNDGVDYAQVQGRADEAVLIVEGPSVDIWTIGSSSLLVDDEGDVTVYGDVTANGVSLAATKATADAAVPKALVDAKGDLLAGSANDTPIRVPVGANGTTVVADSAAAAGLRWGGPADIGAADRAVIGNLLTANQATIANGVISGWEIVGGGQTLAASTTQAYVGTHSLLITQSTTAALQARTTPATEVTSGAAYTASARARLAVGTRSAYARIFWFQANGTTTVGSASVGATVNLSADGWTELVVTGVAPEGAATARVNITSATGAVGDAMYVDAIGLWRGTGGEWVPPGQPVPNLIPNDGDYESIDIARRSTVNSQFNAIGNLLPEGMATSEDGVTVWRNAGGGVVITNDATYARTGTRSQKITTTEQAALASATVGLTLNSRYAVIPGRTYTFAVWVRSDTANENWVARIYWYNASNAATTPSVSDGSVFTLAVDDWTLLIVSGVAPATAAVCSPTIVRTAGTPGASVWADDATLHVGAGGVSVPPGQLVPDLISPSPVLTRSTPITWNPAQPVLEMSGTATVTLPLASANANRTATIVNNGSGTITVSRTSPDLIGGSLTSFTIPGQGSVQLISNGTGWLVLQGRYTNSTVGKATYEWDHSAPGWRLIAYDSGVRDISSLLVNGWALTGTGHCTLRRTTSMLEVNFMLNASSATDAIFLNDLGAAFRPVRLYYSLACISTVVNQSLVSLWNTNGTVRVYNATQPSIYGVLTGAPPSTLPTSLPGTQITAPV